MWRPRQRDRKSSWKISHRRRGKCARRLDEGRKYTELWHTVLQPDKSNDTCKHGGFRHSARNTCCSEVYSGPFIKKEGRTPACEKSLFFHVVSVSMFHRVGLDTEIIQYQVVSKLFQSNKTCIWILSESGSTKTWTPMFMVLLVVNHCNRPSI